MDVSSLKQSTQDREDPMVYMYPLKVRVLET